MTGEQDITAIEQRVLALLRAKLGVKARTLAAGMKRAGRKLPKAAHQAADVICAAQIQEQHPKLARLVDYSAVERAEQTLQSHLQRIDPKKRRTDAVLGMLGVQAFNVLAVFALVLGLAYWRGLL